MVVEGIDQEWVYVMDPASGRRKMSREEFTEGYIGVVLRFEPQSDFVPRGSRRNIFQSFVKTLIGTESISGSKTVLAYIALCGLLITILSLATPIALFIFSDSFAAGNSLARGSTLVEVLLLAAAMVFLINFIKQRLLHHLAGRISISMWDRSVSNLLKTPVEFFNHRLEGDIVARIQSIDKIADGVSIQFFSLLLELALAVVFFVLMLWFDPILALIVFGLSLMCGMIMYVLERARSDHSAAWRREQGLMHGLGTFVLRHLEVMRITGGDDQIFSRWSGLQAREVSTRQRYFRLSHINQAMPGLFAILCNAAVLVMCAVQVIDGNMSLGTMVGFYIVASMFIAPIGRFVTVAGKFVAIETHIQRLEDISEAAIDPEFANRSDADEGITTLNGKLKLAGHVELRNVTFGYALNRKPLIENFNLEIRPGQRVALVGGSGSGKSTIACLVSGLYTPWSGDICFDQHLRHDIPSEVIARSIAMVDQNIVAFSATVRENITLWNHAIPEEYLIAAAKDACIHEAIMDRPNGYNSWVEESAKNFSGGQAQRLEIARALANEPTVLILDEATSALDALTEQEVDDAIRRRGISCLIVAHRLSTIRDCDEILVLDNGVVTQRGTHDELVADKSGAYWELFMSSSSQE